MYICANFKIIQSSEQCKLLAWLEPKNSMLVSRNSMKRSFQETRFQCNKVVYALDIYKMIMVNDISNSRNLQVGCVTTLNMILI